MNCLHCDKEIVGRKRKFCNKECCALYHYTPQKINHVCPSCGKSFVANSRKIYCSELCSARAGVARWRARKDKAPVVLCVDCGSPTDSRHKGKKRCSACQDKRNKEFQKERGSYSYKKEHHKGYLEKAKNDKQKRRARIAGLENDFSVSDWSMAKEHFSGKCAYCGKDSEVLHREHFVPLRRGGGYTKRNIVPACPDCNHRKHANQPLDWLVNKEHGLLRFLQIKNYLDNV